MKTTINKSELIKFNACKPGLELFANYHADNTVNLSDCFNSNSLDDIFWLLEELEDRKLLSDSQLKGLRLFAADCAESVLHLFENEHSEDNRPRLAIQAARDYSNGLISSDAMYSASYAARGAASSAARGAARYVASSAARSAARYAASYAANSASWAAARYAASSANCVDIEQTQTETLKSLFLEWEGKA